MTDRTPPIGRESHDAAISDDSPMTTEQLAVFFQDESEFCGCGNPEDAAKRLLDLLDLHPLYDHRREFEELLPDVGFQHLLLYWLDSLGLTEHGGSVGGAWLTDKGIAVRDALRREWDADKCESLFDQRCIHGYLVTDADHVCT